MSMSSSAPRAAAAGGSSGLIEFFRHHGAWAPGVKLFRRIQFRAKAVIILVVLVVPLLVLGWNYFGDKAVAIAFTTKELHGTEYAREVLPLVTLAQRQRELAALAQIKGADSSGLSAANDAFDAQLRKVEQLDARLGAELGTDKALAALKLLAPAAAGGDWQKVYTAYTARVEAAVALLTQAADGSNLTLDPDLDSYYLMESVTATLPAVIETTAKLNDMARAVARGLPVSASIAH